MNTLTRTLALYLCLVPLWAQTPHAELRGAITDPSGAAVPGASVELRGPGGDHRTRTDRTGHYQFTVLAPGKYRVRIAANGFAPEVRDNFAITGAQTFDLQLTIAIETRVVSIDDGNRRVNTEPAANGGAVRMGQRELAALSDDPDELALQLQALAGPAPGPNGGQVYIDGFTGGNLPPKSSIREVRVNANPFSSEYDHPGFARVEIFTKPGSDLFHGQAFFQYNDRVLNSRNPLLAQSSRPPYGARLGGASVTGPLRKNKASFAFDGDRRQIHENAFILATTLDSGLNPILVNQALAAPQTRTTLTPRLDYSLSAANTLMIRYQDVSIGVDNAGTGDFNLASRAYNQRQSERTVQVSETAALSASLLAETRFQYMRTTQRDSAVSGAPGINVNGAFYAGGATPGNSSATVNNWELSNVFTAVRGKHSVKWGGRLRQTRIADTSFGGFNGTFTFYTLAQYQRTLALQQAGYSAAQIVQIGAGASQFSISAGQPESDVNQTDGALFFNDDWRVRPNLTLSFGMRYEAQTNEPGAGNWAPRVGLAWGLDAGANRPAKTVLRAGWGEFLDRVPVSAALNALRFNGATQQSYLIFNPSFFPVIPSLESLKTSAQPQQLQPVFAGIASPRLYQATLGIERQFNAQSRVTVTYAEGRGVHLLNARNINAPVSGLYPYGDSSVRLLTESSGFSRLHQLIANANVTYRKLFLFGYYSWSYGKDDNEGLPADPYNLRAEWGPSSYGDVRHRAALGTTIPLPLRLSASSFLIANSGQPYNITTGLDPNLTGAPAQRPSLLTGLGSSACSGAGLMYEAGFGCFNLTPAPGASTVGRNSARGPAAVNLTMRVSRTWAFGRETQDAGASGGGQHGSGSMGGAAPAAGMFGPVIPRKYSFTLTASTMNALNHPNFATPSGDLSSIYFGQYRSLGGIIAMAHGGPASTYNRKIDLQLRFAF